MFRKIKDNINFKKQKKLFEKMFIDSEKINNTIVTKNIRLSNNTIKTRRNNNIFILDKNDSKYYSFIKPNLEQMNSNYVIIDNDGKLYKEFNEKFIENDYNVQTIDFINLSGNNYNPFLYIRDDLDLLLLNASILRKFNNDSQSVKFKIQMSLINTVTYYMLHHCQKNELCFLKLNELLKNFENLKKEILQISKTNENDISFKQLKFFINFVDENETFFINELRKELNNLFDSNVLKIVENVNHNENLDLSFNKKTAIFIKIPNLRENNKTPFLSIIISQMINYIITTAYNLPRKQYKKEIKFFLDDFDKFDEMLEFDKKMAVAKMYNVSFSIFSSNLENIKIKYENWECIIGNCDSILYFASTKETFDYLIFTPLNCQETTKLLDFTDNKFKTVDELNLLESDCIYILRGVYPILDQKYF